ncbi:MAG: MBL fold metallo-hydrolase [Archaeoglobales archaeon]|nr:MBL fold metallo-hydrolase [Archaeoglobales archaeon]
MNENLEVAREIFIIPGRNWGSYPSSNCLYLKDLCLIDGGAESAWELKPEVIVNSHWHEDHISMNSVAKKIYAHELDAKAIESYEEFERRYALGEVVKLFLAYYPKLAFRKVNEFIEEGEVLKFGNKEIEVIHTPGHSAGHCCFLLEGKILYLADIDLTSFGPWYGCVDCDLQEFLDSIDKLLKIAKSVEIAVPSHGEPVKGENLQEKLLKYREKIFERERKIIEALKSGIDPVGKGIIYRKLPEPAEIYKNFEKIMIEKHLKKLNLKSLSSADKDGS